MPITEIAKLRQCGLTRFHSIYQYPVDLNQILGMCGLKQKAEKLLEINASQAIATLTQWLHREPAYDSVLMPLEKAEELAATFVREFADQTSRFYTNGRWFESGQVRSWEPLSDFVFDGGLLIQSGTGNYTHHVCIWFEDED